MMICSALSYGNSLYHPPGPNLTLGNINHGHGMMATTSNPAAPAVQSDYRRGVGLSLGAGLNYGNVDEIFEIIDAVSEMLGSDGEDIPESPPPDLPEQPVQLPSNPTWQDIVAENPELEAWLEAVKSQASFLGGSLAVIAAEAYAKAFVVVDTPVLVGRDVFGGSLTFALNAQGTSKVLGIVDRFDWDSEQALSQIDAARQLPSDAPETTFELSDDVLLVVDPANNTVNLKFNNESLLLTKAAFISNMNVGYSRNALALKGGTLSWGVKAKVYRVGLSLLDTRFGDVTDSEALFEDIRHSDFRNSTRMSLDLGALWHSDRYSVGATLTDVFSPAFSFPQIDRSKYLKNSIQRRLKREEEFNIERQLRIEGSVFSMNRRWNANFEWDVNSIADPMGDQYQWLVLSGAYDSRNRWTPDFRLGLRHNLAGDHLTYLAGGLSLLDVFTLDLSSTLETVTLEGDTLPRGLGVSLGLNFAF